LLKKLLGIFQEG